MSQKDPAISFRYLVHDVGAAVDFYGLLGCDVRTHPGPGFAQLSLDGVAVNLNAVGGEGGASQQVAGETPVPGGWNRIQLRVADLDARLASLASGARELGLALLLADFPDHPSATADREAMWTRVAAVVPPHLGRGRVEGGEALV